MVSLQRKNLLETAERQTGLQDRGDPRFDDALAALVDSVNQEGRLTFFGRLAIRQFLVENLASRLRIIEVLKRFPEIQQQHIVKPIFITGWYRSGTTYLHHLLASHPHARAPLFWELRHPCPTIDPRAADPHRLIRKVRLESRIHRWLAPGFNAVHPMAAEKPEECLHLFDKACAGTTAFVITAAKSFAWWLLENGIEQGYEFFKLQLQLLNWLRPGRQWVLKWPYHLWHLDALLRTFPDGTIVYLHRDPGEAIPSACNLAALAAAPFCEGIDLKLLGKFWLDYCATGLQRGLAARGQAPKNQVIDIRYPDLISNPLQVINQIQNSSSLGTSEAWKNSLQASLNATQRNLPTRHNYTGSRFGLNATQIREQFHPYIQEYDLSTS